MFYFLVCHYRLKFDCLGVLGRVHWLEDDLNNILITHFILSTREASFHGGLFGDPFGWSLVQADWDFIFFQQFFDKDEQLLLQDFP
jgi:hypothetical protein